jgi:molybdopterin molybdotransferase
MTKQGFGKLATLPEAFDIIENILPKIEDENVPIERSNGRILSEDIITEVNVPSFRKSAMDGFAIIAEDSYGASNNNSKKLKIIESVTAGIVPKKDLKPSECIEITTGAPLPKSATAVLMVEFTEKKSNDEIIYYKTCAPNENVIQIGSDIKKDQILFKKGTKLNPRFLGAIAAIGKNDILVKKKPKIAYFSTGNEIIDSGDELVEGKVYDINTRTIVDSLKEHPCIVNNLGVVKDDLQLIKKTITDNINEVDILLLSGGSSLGGEDFMVEAVKELGEVLVHGIAAKPGKPVLIGKVKDKLVLGLPGYPTSALSNTYSLVIPVLYNLLGSKLIPIKTKMKLSRKIASTIGRYEFLAVKIDENYAVPVMKGSSSITTLSEADGYICIDENTEVVNKDDIVEVNIF